MADLLSSSDKVSFQNSVLDLFDTFSRNITVHKEPQKKIISIDAHLLPGYDETSSPANIEYVPRSETFKAIIRYDRKQETETESWAGINIPQGQVGIKVKDDAKKYIENGHTIKVVIDEKNFKLVSNSSIKDYFGMKMYVYYVEEMT
tara:strand:- start:685 stop:1125 length:441 start_codon:yes stop_codon:yes gene_type:complete